MKKLLEILVFFAFSICFTLVACNSKKEAEFAAPLKKGVKTFHTFVSSWYDCRFQDVVYHDKHNDDIKAMISSVLAGYAWDENNPYVKDSERRMNVLAEICRST